MVDVNVLLVLAVIIAILQVFKLQLNNFKLTYFSVCGSLPSKERPPRKGDTCECDDGWSGINCNGKTI
jgi:hypothetical protein